MLIRSADYREAHGLDGRFFAHNEEIDLCWRLRQRGRRIVCIPESEVYHVGGGTLPKSNPMKTFLNFRNNLKMLVADRSWADFKAVVKARRAFYRWRHNFDDDRREIGRTRTASPSERVGYSILWQYYVKGRKTFSRL